MKAILKSNELIKVTGIDETRKIAFFTYDKGSQYEIERFVESIGASFTSISGGFSSPQKTASINW